MTWQAFCKLHSSCCVFLLFTRVRTKLQLLQELGHYPTFRIISLGLRLVL